MLSYSWIATAAWTLLQLDLGYDINGMTVNLMTLDLKWTGKSFIRVLVIRVVNISCGMVFIASSGRCTMYIIRVHGIW